LTFGCWSLVVVVEVVGLFVCQSFLGEKFVLLLFGLLDFFFFLLHLSSFFFTSFLFLVVKKNFCHSFFCV